MPYLGKHISGLQVGMGIEAILFSTLFAVIFYQKNRFRRRHLNNDLVWLTISWMVLTFLQIGNPERPSILGWVYEMRSSTLYWVLTVVLTFLVFNKRTDINLFLNIIIIMSFIGALYGMKQLYLGVDEAEHKWLEEGGKKHIFFR